MKITHRNPAASWFYVPPSAVVDADYEAEVQRCTDRGEREYQRRMARLAKAEARLAKARTVKKIPRRRLADLVAVVELRRAELEEYRRMMTSSPASATHRGPRGYRPVPPVHGSPL